MCGIHRANDGNEYAKLFNQVDEGSCLLKKGTLTEVPSRYTMTTDFNDIFLLPCEISSAPLVIGTIQLFVVENRCLHFLALFPYIPRFDTFHREDPTHSGFFSRFKGHDVASFSKRSRDPQLRLQDFHLKTILLVQTKMMDRTFSKVASDGIIDSGRISCGGGGRQD